MTTLLPHENPLCQRWNERTPSWRSRREGGFDQHRYTVVDLDETCARQFVLTHHYSGAWPAAVHRYGLWDRGDDRLAGVLVLGVPVTPAVLTSQFPQLEPYSQALELSRLILLDQVPSNGESWFCTQSFRRAAAEGIRGLVAYSDPTPRHRTTDHGVEIISPGHVGTVYQACSARHTGRTSRRKVTVLPDGTVLHGRAVTKVIKGESGSNGVIERLLAYAGAQPPQPGEDRRAWLTATLQAIGATTEVHPSKYRYIFALGGRTRRRRLILPPAQPYPKKTGVVSVA